MLFDDFSFPVFGEILEGRVFVELDKASFRPNTHVFGIAIGGKYLSGKTISTAAVGFRMPVEAIIDVSGMDKPLHMSGMLISAEGIYKKYQGIVVEKGTSAVVLSGAKTFSGKMSEAIRIGIANLRVSSDVKGFKRQPIPHNSI